MTWQTDWAVKVYAFGVEPALKPTSTSWVIGHPTRGGLDSTNVIGDTSVPQTGFDAEVMKWATDITCDVEEIATDRGKSRPTESFPGGVCTLTIATTNNDYDPRSTVGRFCVAGRQLWRRGVPIVVCVESTTPLTLANRDRRRFCLFGGRIDRSEADHSVVGPTRRYEVTCNDMFAELARFDLDNQTVVVGAGEGLAQRVLRWCAAARLISEPVLSPPAILQATPSSGIELTLGMTFGVEQVGLPGSSGLQGTLLNENGLSAIKAAAASIPHPEGAHVFVTKQGRIRVTEPSWVSVPTWTITDDPIVQGPTNLLPGAWPQVTLDGSAQVEQDEDSLRTVAMFARAGGVTQTAVSPEADELGLIVQSRTDLVCETDSDVAGCAQSFVSRFGRRFLGGAPTVVTCPINPSVDWGALMFSMHAELLDQVQFSWTGRVSVFGHLIKISHRIRPNQQGGWQATAVISEVV